VGASTLEGRAYGAPTTGRGKQDHLQSIPTPSALGSRLADGPPGLDEN